MIVDNFYKMIGRATIGSCKVKTVDGEAIVPYNSVFWFNMDYAINTGMSGGSNGPRIGTGTTPPTLGDYKLSGSQITTITSTYTPGVVTETAEGVSRSVTYTITNTGTEPITIGEIASFVGVQTKSGGSYSLVMMERTVLDIPLTIPAGEIGKLTYTIDFKFPVE